MKKSPEVVHQFLTTSVHALFGKIDEKTHDIATLFASREIVLTSDALAEAGSWQKGLELLDANREVQLPQQVTLTLNLKGFNKKADYPFDITQAIKIDLDELEYHLDTGGPPHFCSKYDKGLSPTITDEIVRDLLRKLFHQLQERTKV